MSAAQETIADEGSFRGVKARKIVWRSWSPVGEEPAKGVVTLAHGYGEHSGRYAHVASRLTAAGYAVYAPDHNAHGRSKGKPGRVSLAAAIADLNQMIVRVSVTRHPDAPQFLLGHSMGGAIALRYAIAHQDRLAGLVVSAPLAAVDGGPALKAVGKLLGVILPGVPVGRVDPRLVSRDKAVVDAYVADPLNYHGPIPAGVGRQFLMSTETLRTRCPPDHDSDTLAMGHRRPAMSAPWRRGGRRQHRLERLHQEDYEGLFHEIMNEPEKDQVLDEIIGWLGSHLVPTAEIWAR